MVIYTCNCCNFVSKIKTHYNRHLKTEKHKRKSNNIDHINLKTQKDPIQTKKQSQSKFICIFCGDFFSTHAHKRRHEIHRCKKNEELNYKKLYKQSEKEKKELYKKMDHLIEKVGNTTNIHNTQNVQLNNYGNEDLSHITDSLKDAFIKIPYGMIPKMIEAVHFNDNKPENKNIILPNKNEKKIKIFRGDKWIYKNKEDVVTDLIDGKYFIMDTHYEKVSDNLENSTIYNYTKFKKYYEEKDKDMIEKLKEECNNVLLNNR